MKKFARVLSSSLLKMALATAAIAASFVGVFSSPETIKKSLADSNVYDNVISNLIEAAQEEGDGEGASDVPKDKQLSVEVLRKSATESFTPAVIQDSLEEGLDGTYRWLNGDVSVPDFQIDL